MADDEPIIPVSYEEAVAIATEIAVSLGGRQARALDVLMRYAARGNRPSSTRMAVVGAASFGAQHFMQAQKEIAAGLDQVHRATSQIAAEEHEERKLDAEDVHRKPR